VCPGKVVGTEGRPTEGGNGLERSHERKRIAKRTVKRSAKHRGGIDSKNGKLRKGQTTADGKYLGHT